MMDLSKVPTENRNQASVNIDQMDTLSMVELMNEEDQKVAIAVKEVTSEIAQAVDEMCVRFSKGGRLVYIGAGTSGRLGSLDAIELTPTYSVLPDQAFGIIAGGKEAMFSAIEGAEDDQELAVNDLKKIELTSNDTLIGIAASGRTPYTVSAIEYGNKVGALTISVTCNKIGEMNQLAQIGIAPIVGPEVISGSTRMKAGTAQKLVLNMLSTAVMVKTGKVFQNLMINVQPTNKKLIQRAINIIHDGTGVSHDEAEKYLKQSNQNVAVSIVMIKTGFTAEKAAQLLNEHQGKISQALLVANKN